MAIGTIGIEAFVHYSNYKENSDETGLAHLQRRIAGPKREPWPKSSIALKWYLFCLRLLQIYWEIKGKRDWLPPLEAERSPGPNGSPGRKVYPPLSADGGSGGFHCLAMVSFLFKPLSEF